MLSLATAQQLKEAGLSWVPAKHDFFAIPYPELSDQVFVMTDISVLLEQRSGRTMITFHGVAEWALDHVLLTEAVWLPTEAQLRTLLEDRLRGEPGVTLRLRSTLDGYECELSLRGEPRRFEAFGASEGYAAALLHVLQSPH